MLEIDEILEELIRLRESSGEDTEKFSSFNHDELCLKVQEVTNCLGDFFVKYESISYLVQGPRDQGVDVLLKISHKDEPERYVGIQVKSYAEIEDKNNELSKNLKAGFHDARNHYGENLERYYIFLCGDSKKHFKRISAITNEFSKEKKLRVITPRYLFSFINLTQQTIAAVVEAFLRDEDYVRSKARKEVIEYNPQALTIVLNCLAEVLEGNDDKLTSDFIYQELESDFEAKHSDDNYYEELEDLEESVFERSAYSDRFRFRVELFPALRALYYDLQVRYDCSKDKLLEILHETFTLQ